MGTGDGGEGGSGKAQPPAEGSGALKNRIEEQFAKMNRLLDGEEVSSMTAGGLTGSLVAVAGPRRAVAEEAMALLAHRAGAPIGDCDNAEQAASRVRAALERPLREELAVARRELQRRNEAESGGPSFRERLVIEAAETLARAVAQRDEASLAAAVARIVDRVRLLHDDD